MGSKWSKDRICFIILSQKLSLGVFGDAALVCYSYRIYIFVAFTQRKFRHSLAVYLETSIEFAVAYEMMSLPD